MGVLLGFLFSTLVSASQSPAVPSVPPTISETLVDVGGRRLHLSCSGSGSPTVILEAGLGDSSATWKAVQPAVAEATRVCAYDRAGRGKSDPDPRIQTEVRTSRAAVDDLSRLLRSGAVSGPYILAGHSLGGAYIRLYASRFPQDVVGMVLVDASHERQVAAFQSAGYTLPPSAASDNSERTDMPASLAEVGQAPWRADIPLVVVSHGGRIAEGIPGIDAAVAARIETAWLELQRELAGRSPQGRLIIAGKSGHYVQNDAPEVVIQAIRDVVAAARRPPAGR